MGRGLRLAAVGQPAGPTNRGGHTRSLPHCTDPRSGPGGAGAPVPGAPEEWEPQCPAPRRRPAKARGVGAALGLRPASGGGHPSPDPPKRARRAPRRQPCSPRSGAHGPSRRPRVPRPSTHRRGRRPLSVSQPRAAGRHGSGITSRPRPAALGPAPPRLCARAGASAHAGPRRPTPVRAGVRAWGRKPTPPSGFCACPRADAGAGWGRAPPRGRRRSWAPAARPPPAHLQR